MRCQVAAFAVVLSVAAAGCGGGGSSSSGEPAPEAASFSFGNLEGRAAATNPPLRTNSADVTAIGLKGAITSLRLRDQSTSLDETRIVFAASIHDPAPDIYISSYDGSDLRRLTANTGVADVLPRVSPAGDKVAFGRNGDIYVMSISGGSATQLTTDPKHEEAPSWSPNGAELVYTVFHGGASTISKVNVSTLAVTPLTAAPGWDLHPTFTPDGSRVVFGSNRTNGYFVLHVVASSGGAISTFNSPETSDNQYPRFSPDGTTLAYLKFGVLTLQHPFSDAPQHSVGSVQSVDRVDWSPDGSRLVFVRTVGSLNQFFTAKPDGTDVQRLFPNLLSSLAHPSWAPGGDKVFIAASGAILASSADGFIVGQQGPTTRGLLVFDGTTPSSVVMTASIENNEGPNLVFSIDADNMTLISYANTPSWKATKVVGSGTSLTSASGALVSLDSATGKVVAVLPFTGTRARQSVRDEGSMRIFEGTFLGAFDAVGANAAPAGASTVRLDLASGRLEAG